MNEIIYFYIILNIGRWVTRVIFHWLLAKYDELAQLYFPSIRLSRSKSMQFSFLDNLTIRWAQNCHRQEKCNIKCQSVGISILSTCVLYSLDGLVISQANSLLIARNSCT